MVSLIESGKYAEALACTDISSFLFKLDFKTFYPNTVDAADQFYAEIMEHVHLFFNSNSSVDDTLYRAFLVMTVSIASLLAFVQCNLTGPVKVLPSCPLPWMVSQVPEWENWARNQIMSAGSDLLGRFTNLQYLVFAKMLLTKTKDYLFGQTVESPFGIRTISWWLARINFIQQKIMDERSSSLFDSLQVLVNETLEFGPLWHQGKGEKLLGRYLLIVMRKKLLEEAKAQLVLVTNSRGSSIDNQGPFHDSSDKPGQSNGHGTLQAHQSKTLEASDVLMTPKLVACGNSKGNKGYTQNGLKSMKPIQQAVVLAQCLLIEKSTRNDEMQSKWASIDIRFLCDILRIRWESTRSRTKERALLIMEELVQSVFEFSSEVAERIHTCFGASFPTIPALRKEYGELLVRCALIGEALKVFEDLELWDNLIYCYWCVRESAMAMNSLNPGGWFSLGSAALKARDIEKALDGFTRAVQLDPENGEAWNNIACLHMIRKKNKESCIAFKEALKFKRNIWQLWENYAQVSADVGNFTQALEAVQMVLELTNNKRTDAALLESVMVEIEKATSNRQSTNFENVADLCQPSDSINESARTEHLILSSREIENLLELIGKILPRIIRSTSGDGVVWGLYARWHKLKVDLAICGEAFLKQVRSYQGSDVWKDKEKFKKYVHASLDLCKVYIEIFLSTGSRRELMASEMHLKNVIKQAIEFSDTDD
ncbi:hypothetical protein QQ045_015810 [Rhodiola kirilowii]